MKLINFNKFYGLRIYSYKKDVISSCTFDGITNTFKKLLDFTDYVTWKCSIYWIWVIYKQDISLNSIIKYVLCYNITYTLLCLCRCVAIKYNKYYDNFNKLLKLIETDDRQLTYNYIRNDNLLKKLNEYDVNILCWPIRYKSMEYTTKSEIFTSNNSYMKSILNYILAYYFGLTLIYPGSIPISNILFSKQLKYGRIKLKKNETCYRCIIDTALNDHVDTLFVDRRPQYSDEPPILVIVSDGNFSYYELGLINILLYKTHYSCLGWNSPGYGESEGVPFDVNVQISILSIIDYAINRLGFKEEDIILIGWSIGGYPSVYGASKYKNIKGLVLDATFNSLETLAIYSYPALEKFIKLCIPTYFNMNHGKLLQNYSGPVNIIVRTNDEVMTKHVNGVIKHETMELALNILKFRYPNIFDNNLLKKIQSISNMWIQNATKLDSKGELLLYSYDSESDKINDSMPVLSSTFPNNSYGNDLSDEQKIDIALKLMSIYICIYPSSHNDIFDYNSVELPPRGL